MYFLTKNLNDSNINHETQVKEDDMDFIQLRPLYDLIQEIDQNEKSIRNVYEAMDSVIEPQGSRESFD